MAITKNKILLRDKSISIKSEIDSYYNDWCGSWDDYDDYQSSYCDCCECNDYWGGQCIYEGNWKYLDDPIFSDDMITRGSHWIRKSKRYIIGRVIDMDSIYREVLREKKIDRILGVDNFKYPTLGDIFQKNNFEYGN